MELIRISILAGLTVLAIGCGRLPDIEIPQSPSAPATPAQTQAPATPVEASIPSSTKDDMDPALPVVSVTYHQRTATRVPSPTLYPSRSYTATGFCAIYLARTYCWDDGTKTVITGFTGYYSYWGLFFNGHGGLSLGNTYSDDVMAAPRVVAGAVASNINSVSLGTVASVLTGTSTTLECTDNAGVVDCGDFVIDTTQTTL